MKERTKLKELIDKHKYDGVLLIDIPGENPALVFKTYLAPLRRIEHKNIYAPASNDICGEHNNIIDCHSYWHGKFSYNKFPSVVHQFYPAKFTQMIELQEDFINEPEIRPRPGGVGYIIPITKMFHDYDATKNTKEPYDPNNLPRGCFELKLSSVLDRKLWYKEVKSADNKKYEFARKVFSQYGFIIDKRGQHRRIFPKAIERRNERIFKEYRKIVKERNGKERPYPIKEIQELLPTKDIYKNQSVFYSLSDDTIRRIIDKGRVVVKNRIKK